MSSEIARAVAAITMALVFYTIGVYWEHRDLKLRPVHLIFFWLGFCMDSVGTGLMAGLRTESGGLVSGLHAVLGIIAIVLMFLHAIWATAIIVLRDEKSARIFHRMSVSVWEFWLIPFALGMVLGMFN